MKRMPVHPGTLLIGALLALCLTAAGLVPGRLEAHTLQDEKLPNVGVDEKPGAQVPLDLPFTDQDGRKVRLGDYLTGGPVILTLNYYSCPTLCPLIFRNLSDTIIAIKGLLPGKDYRIVTVSIDQEETTAMARAKSGETWRMLPGLANPERNWPFLLGTETAIERLTKTVGMRYVRLEKNNYAHPSVILVLTPAGKVARYLYGIEQRPADLKLALLEAADGKIGGSPFLNQVLLYCYHYDPIGKKYALAAVNVMKIGGGAVLLLMGVLLFSLWRRDKGGAETRGKKTGG
ncbi:SCO family protein [Geotalea uraniireducens]|nr:SCO family protein [Geotalea uraniireducens]